MQASFALPGAAVLVLFGNIIKNPIATTAADDLHLIRKIAFYFRSQFDLQSHYLAAVANFLDECVRIGQIAVYKDQEKLYPTPQHAPHQEAFANFPSAWSYLDTPDPYSSLRWPMPNELYDTYDFMSSAAPMSGFTDGIQAPLFGGDARSDWIQPGEGFEAMTMSGQAPGEHSAWNGGLPAKF